MYISNLDPKQIEAEITSQGIYTAVQSLERLYVANPSAVMAVRDVLAECSDMLVAMCVALKEREYREETRVN